MEFYLSEYEDYWSRDDRWGSDSYKNVEKILVPLITCCGKGKVLDIGCGMGRLVRAMLRVGIDAYGMDVSERVIAASRKVMPDRFYQGSALEAPFADGSFDTVVSSDCLEHLAPKDVVHSVSEIARLTRRYVYLMVSTALDRDRRWHLTVRPREWWEELFFSKGFRRHPLLQSAVPFEGLESEPASIPLVFEKDPGGVYQDKQSDWGKHSGRIADAYMAFYTLGSKFIHRSNRVLDSGCRTGFGSAILAAASPEAQIVGIDSDGQKLAYAHEHYAATYRNLEFARNLNDKNGNASAKFDLALLLQPELPDGSAMLWNMVETQLEAVRPGGILLMALPTNATFLGDAGLERAIFTDTIEDMIYPPVKGIFPQHLFAIQWEQVRSLAELKLPAHKNVPDADLWVLAYKKEPAFTSGLYCSRRDRVVILANHCRDDQYADFISQSPFPLEFVHEYQVDWEPPLDAGLVMSLQTNDEPCISALRTSMGRGVPTLILADEMSVLFDTSLHQGHLQGRVSPVNGHKIACIGAAQARMLNAWGNYGKCEIVGIPRLDRYRALKQTANRLNGRMRVLIATPEIQSASMENSAVLNGLRDLQEFFNQDAKSDSPAFETCWKISPQFAQDLSLESTECCAKLDISQALINADALITTPQGFIIEGMLAGVPVAVFDYGNSLNYFLTAWRITATTHVASVMQALCNPSLSEQMLQDYVLHDLCSCSSPATPRLIYLVEQMIVLGQHARQEGQPLRFPIRIISPDASEMALNENPLAIDHIYPDHARFKRNHSATLELETRLLRRLVGSRQSSLNRLERGLRGWDADLKARTESLAQRESILSRWDSIARQYFGSCGNHEEAISCFLALMVAAQATERPVYCWGAGEFGRRLIVSLKSMAEKICGFIDSDPLKKGIAWGKPVYAPSVLWESRIDNRPFVLIASIADAEIAASLNEKGFERGRDYVSVPFIDSIPS